MTHATAVVEALKRGMKLIVVDPRRVGLANTVNLGCRCGRALTGRWRPASPYCTVRTTASLSGPDGPVLVRADTGRKPTLRDLDPDGDAAVVLAWDNAAQRPIPMTGDTTHFALEGEHRIATLESEVVCRPAFALYCELCARYSTDVVAPTCWIEAADVEAAARLPWQNQPVSYYAWSGHEQHANVTRKTAVCLAFSD